MIIIVIIQSQANGTRAINGQGPSRPAASIIREKHRKTDGFLVYSIFEE